MISPISPSGFGVAKGSKPGKRALLSSRAAGLPPNSSTRQTDFDGSGDFPTSGYVLTEVLLPGIDLVPIETKVRVTGVDQDAIMCRRKGLRIHFPSIRLLPYHFTYEAVSCQDFVQHRPRSVTLHVVQVHPDRAVWGK